MALHPRESDRTWCNSESGERTVWLITIDIHLVTAGTLIVAITATRRPQNLSLRKLKSLWHATPIRNCVLRIAPNGAVAQLADEGIPPNSEGTDEFGGQRRKLSERQSMQKPTQAWKSAVKVWLEWRGIYLTDLSREESWTTIWVPNQPRQHTVSSAGYSVPIRALLWPVALCLCYVPKTMMHTDGRLFLRAAPEEPSCFDVVNPIDWFRLQQQPGFQDPYQFPQDWFLKKPERDKAIDAFQQSQKAAEEEAAITQVDIATAFPSSPVYSRGMYGDIQAASGVYPTPPDGVFFQGLGGSALIDGSNIAEAQLEHDAEATEGEEGDTSDVGRDIYNAPVDEAHQPNYAQQESDAMDFDAAFDDGTDDLFEDIDEDIYTSTGNDITEADFSFFDEPDATGPSSVNSDGFLSDGHNNFQSEGQSNSSTLPKPLQAAGLSLQAAKTHASERRLVAGQVDPSLPSGMEPDHVHTQHQTVIMAETPGGQAFNSSADVDAEASEFDLTKVTESPLSPIKIRKKLLGSLAPAVLSLEMAADKGVVSVDQRESSKFNHVAFSSDLGLVDAKYGAEGCFKYLSKSQRKRTNDTYDGLSTCSSGTEPKRVCITLPTKISRMSSRIKDRDERKCVKTTWPPGESGHITPQEQSDTSDDDTASTVPSVPAADVQDDTYASLQWQPFRVLATAKRNLEFDGDAMSPLYGSFGTVDEDRHTGDDDLGDMSEVRNLHVASY